MKKIKNYSLLQITVVSLMFIFASNVCGIITENERKLLEAAKENNFKTIENLIKANVNVNIFDERRYTPLIIAIENGNIEAVQSLLKAKDIDIEYKLPEYISMEVKGYDYQINVGNASPLLIAIFYEQNDIVKLLLENNADTKSEDISRQNSILYAGAFGNADILKMLIDKDKSLSESKGGYYFNALDLAVAYNKQDNIKYLVETLNYDINSKNIIGWTPLYYAASNGNLEVCKLLIKLGADKNIKSNEGKTPYDIAKEHGYEEVYNYLEK